MIRMRPLGLLLLFLGLGLLAGCSQTKPPLTEMDNAGRSVRSASDAGASTYAPMELRVAQERLNLARSAMQEKEYEQAIALADEAQVASDLAMTKSRLGKAREKVETRTRENEQLRNDLFPSGDINLGGGQ